MATDVAVPQSPVCNLVIDAGANDSSWTALPESAELIAANEQAVVVVHADSTISISHRPLVEELSPPIHVDWPASAEINQVLPIGDAALVVVLRGELHDEVMLLDVAVPGDDQVSRRVLSFPIGRVLGSIVDINADRVLVVHRAADGSSEAIVVFCNAAGDDLDRSVRDWPRSSLVPTLASPSGVGVVCRDELSEFENPLGAYRVLWESHRGDDAGTTEWVLDPGGFYRVCGWLLEGSLP
ncbi:MAG: hypothetical protein R3B68_04290 [Phycisphaerales bacterium]